MGTSRRVKRAAAGDGSIPPVKWNAGQAEFFRLIEAHDIVVLKGPAGCGKSHAAVSWAIGARNTNRVEVIAFTRPMVECGGERIGFLPGDAAEKMHPWMMPVKDVATTMVGRVAAEAFVLSCEPWPLAYVRGRTVGARTVLVCEEVQNMSMPQLKAVLTRIGEGGKIILCGDPDQSDLPGGGRHFDVLADELEAGGVAGVVRFTPDQIVRHRLTGRILDAVGRTEARLAKRR